MRTLLLFIFIFGALGFTKCQNTNQALNSRSTLADSATYFGGVLSAEGQFRYLETLGADENTFKKKLFLEGAKWALSCDLPDDYNGYDVYGSLLLNSYLHELEKPDERMYAKDRKILIDSSSYAWGVTAVLYNRAILDARGLNKDLFFSGIQVGLDREFNHLERLKEVTVVEQYMQSLPEKIVKLEASKLDANSTLADSGSYYLGVWEMNQVLEKTAGNCNKDLFLLGTKDYLRNPYDSAYDTSYDNVKEQYEFELEKITAQSLKSKKLLIGAKTSGNKELNANSSLADSASYIAGFLVTRTYSRNRSDLNETLFMSGMQEVLSADVNDSIRNAMVDTMWNVIHRYYVSDVEYKRDVPKQESFLYIFNIPGK